MAKRRFQNPKPFREGNWWWIHVREDQFSDGRLKRKQKRIKVAPATLAEREARKVAEEMLRPMNQGLELIGSATEFRAYVDGVYRGNVLPLLASTTRSNYQWVLDKYLIPTFGDRMLRDPNIMMLQKYFSGLRKNHTTAMKVKDALASVLSIALRFGLLSKNPLVGVQIPSPRVGKRTKPHITPEQFDALVNLISEPYSTMVYVCVLAGLRVSELVGLKWEDVHTDSLTIDARGARKTFKLVRSDAPGDLVFQSLIKRGPMSDHNVLSRHIKPAAHKLGIGWVNWQVLRRSYATWLVEAGADPKAVQAQMRHSRASTTMEIYAQFVPTAQRRAVAQMMGMVTARMAKASPASVSVN
jgi:integrase